MPDRGGHPEDAPEDAHADISPSGMAAASETDATNSELQPMPVKADTTTSATPAQPASPPAMPADANTSPPLAGASAAVDAAGVAAKPANDSVSAPDTATLVGAGSVDKTLANQTDGGSPAEGTAGPDASVATLKPPVVLYAPSPRSASSAAVMQLLDVDSSRASSSRTYVDPTPRTPMTSRPSSRSPSNAAASDRRSSEASPTRSDAAYDDRRYASEDDQENENGSRAEIQSIMGQFSEEGGGPGAEEVMSPRFEIASPMLATPLQHPPRKSSLEPLAPSMSQATLDGQDRGSSASAAASIRSGSLNSGGRQIDPDDLGPPVPPKDRPEVKRQPTVDATLPLSPTVSRQRPPPPEPEPEPALPFDFQRFLEQLRNKKADPVARYLKSFLSEFAKRQWMVHEQVKIISDFLAFIGNKMAVCDVWRDLSDAEFDNSREGMEKLVMNRLYTQTFSPAIPPPQPIPGAKPKRRGGDRPMGPGRRGQHQEDFERDEILSQKINIYSWIREEHLDIPPVTDGGRRFLKLAQQELLKIKSYRAPRDKIICVLNCCKVIFGLLKHNKTDSSADSFMPMLIYVVLKANPEHLVSNVQYILRFRNQDKLTGEAGYYLSSLMGAIQFIENMDRTTLTITDEEFEKNVEAAVSAIAEKTSPLPVPPFSEKEALKSQHLHPPKSGGEPSSSAAGAARNSTDSDAARLSTPRPSMSPEGEDEHDEGDAITGLLRTFQKPLSTIGRIFSDEPSSPSTAPSRSSSLHSQPDSPPANGRPSTSSSSRRALSAEEAAARQASAEAAEAQRLHRVEHASVVETLAGMFPDLDKDIISDVVYQKEGRVGLAVDACLALSS